jgi:nicotinic acid phosphoribosyltransferase
MVNVLHTKSDWNQLDFLIDLKFRVVVLGASFVQVHPKATDSLNVFKPDFLDYLGKLRFTGDLWAMPEGTIFFPNEPVMRVVAPLIEAVKEQQQEIEALKKELEELKLK